MSEKEYKELLEKLKIGDNRSVIEIKELLDAKLSEYIDRQDEFAEQMQSDIQDAIDYVEEMIDKMGGGIALPTEQDREEKEEINRELLKRAGATKEKDIKITQLSVEEEGRNSNSVGQSSVQHTTVKDNKQEKKKLKDRKRNKTKSESCKEIKGTIIKLIIAIATISGVSAFAYHEGVGMLDGIEPLLPNVAYTEDVHIYNTSMPYFISFVPIEELYIQENAKNMKMIFMPFGAESIDYNIAMKSVTIPKQAKSVKLNCAELTNLEIPDGVVSLELYNISSRLTELEIPDSVQFLTLDKVSDDLAENLVLPSGLVSFYLGNVDWGDDEELITDVGFENLKLPDSLQYFNIDNCTKLTEIEITTSLKGLCISGWDGLESVTITGDVENVYLGDVYREGVSDDGEKYGYCIPCPLKQLTITGNVGSFKGGSVENCMFGNGPESLYMEYSGTTPFSLPQNLKNLKLTVNEYNNPNVGDVIASFAYPETAQNVVISRYDAENGAWHGETIVGTGEGLDEASYDCVVKAWPVEALEETIKVQTQ